MNYLTEAGKAARLDRSRVRRDSTGYQDDYLKPFDIPHCFLITMLLCSPTLLVRFHVT